MRRAVTKMLAGLEFLARLVVGMAWLGMAAAFLVVFAAFISAPEDPPGVTVHVTNQSREDVILDALELPQATWRGAPLATPLLLRANPTQVTPAHFVMLEAAEGTNTARIQFRMDGAPREHSFTFTALKGGSCTITLAFRPEGVSGGNCDNWTPSTMGWLH